MPLLLSGIRYQLSFIILDALFISLAAIFIIHELRQLFASAVFGGP
jgi:hypothetical protein